MAYSARSETSGSGRSSESGVSSLIAAGESRWFRFLSRWSLFAGLAVLGIFLAFGVGVVPASQGSPLPQEYSELWATSNSPIAYRLFVTLDIAIWLAPGSFFITLAAGAAGRRLH